MGEIHRARRHHELVQKAQSLKGLLKAMKKQVDVMEQKSVQTEAEMINENMTLSYIKNYGIQILELLPNA